MKTDSSVELSYLGPARNLHVLGVQLASPFALIPGQGPQALAFPEKGHGPPVWHNHAAARTRIAKVHRILESLVSWSDAERPLDVVVFPEYSVPNEAHDDHWFQNFADRHRCLLVPGSAVDDDRESPHYRRNICRIYVPNRRTPLLIGKRMPAPFEEGHVLPFDGVNVARLRWQPEGRPEVSLSFFLGRDYIAPYGEDEGLFPAAPDSGASRILEVDWEHSGIEIALMHCNETRLFEGAAGLGVRGLRGRPKLALLVNSAYWPSELATAMLGPTKTRERDDVVRSLPVNREGFLSAKVDLWEGATAADNAERIEPIQRSTFERIDGKYMAAPIKDDAGPLFRGVWRPAFLAASRLAIGIELYKAQKLMKAISIVESRGGYAYAGVIRGEFDLLVRRYLRADELEGGKGPDFTRFLSDRLRDEFRGALTESENGDSTFSVVVHPQGIWKYRGVQTYDDDLDSRATALRRDLERAARRRTKRDLVAKIRAYAVGCGEHEEPDPEIRNYFYETHEQVIAVRPHTELREAYIFLDVAGSGGGGRNVRFEDEMLKGNFMLDPRVREIFQLAGPGQADFRYLIKVKCKAHETDEIGMDIRKWMEHHAPDGGMRTVDISQYLRQNSVAGIESANYDTALHNFILEFTRTFADGDRTIEHLIAHEGIELVEDCANAWENGRTQCGETDVTRGMTDQISALYTRILAFYGSRGEVDGEREEKAFIDARTAWRNIYDVFEKHCAKGLRNLHISLRLEPEWEEFKISDALQRKLLPKYDAGQWAKHRSETAKAYFLLMGAAVTDKSIQADLSKAMKAIEDIVRTPRNMFFHAARDEIARDMIDLSEKPHEKVSAIETTVEILIGAIDLVCKLNESFSPNVGQGANTD